MSNLIPHISWSVYPSIWQLNPLQLCLVFTTPPSITPPTEGIQNMMGIQNAAAIFCVPLTPYCWDTKYGNHILYPLKDQRGDTEYGRHTEYGVTPGFFPMFFKTNQVFFPASLSSTRLSFHCHFFHQAFFLRTDV